MFAFANVVDHEEAHNRMLLLLITALGTTRL